MARYSAYGLIIDCELRLPELRPVPPTITDHSPDVTIRLGSVPPEGLPGGRQAGPSLWATRTTLWLDIVDVARFLIEDGREILIDPAPGSDEDAVRLFLLGSAFGALLVQRGHLVLHGNAIRIGDRCMICVGPSGTGKSTLAAAFLQRGHDILADDVVPVDQNGHALPGFPRIKLWRNAADALAIDTQGLRRIRPGMEKFSLPLRDRATDTPLPVRWVYILDVDDVDAIALRHIGGMHCFAPLRANSYRPRFVDAMGLQAEHFHLCGRLSGQIRLARVTRPRSGFTLDAMADRLLADMAEHI